MPWEALSPPAPFNGIPRVWRHTVYLGVYRLEVMEQTLGRVFGEDLGAYDGRSDGESACSGMVIDHEGRLVVGSPVLSSAVWATGRTRNPGPADPQWMSGFTTANANFADAIDEFEANRSEPFGTDDSAPHDTDSLVGLLQLAHAAAGVDQFEDLATQRVVIASDAVSARRSNADPDIDFLNSFYLDDLLTVQHHVSEGELGAGLTEYLTPDATLPVGQRIDVVAHPNAIDAATSVRHLPKGRWPANPKHPLALSQQFAVNQAMNSLGTGAGLMGVNGPPGTGKTTMLRDVLAANVVKRAQRLASLVHASDAFTDVTHRWSDGNGHPRIVRQLRPELTGFEMVVASSNNAAVENVTREIPHADAIAGPWRTQADYFSSIATRTLAGPQATNRNESAKGPAAWGLVSARLGKKKNRSDFTAAFWYDEKLPKDKEPAEEKDLRGMQSVLAGWRDGTEAFTPWTKAREAFAAAERRVDRLIRARAQAEERLNRLGQLAQRSLAIRAAIAEQQQISNQVRTDLVRQTAAEQLSVEARTQAAEVYDRHLAVKPGLIENLLSLGRATREWRVPLASIRDDLEDAETKAHDAKHHTQQLHAALARSEQSVTAAEFELSRVSEHWAQLRSECDHDEETFGAAYPGASWTGDERERRAPWLDAELDTARSDLFVAALQLHQDFLANCARDMTNGLRAAVEVISGSHPHDLEPEKLRAAWQLFFLIVPLVSTTFASIERMFGGLGAEAIGWLLIDEAGQASPQNAVGAIWRARRTIAVGDPLQLEPVVTLPHRAQRNIAAGFGLNETWIPPGASVQTLADRITRHGTTLTQGEEAVWVSAPLRVHRRCDNPMFELCNDIAYNNLMVNGVHRTLDDPHRPDLFETPTGPRIAPSHWANEHATTPGSHLQPNQIARLEKALDYLKDHDVPLSDVIVISPFRAVAQRLRTLDPVKYAGLQAGTIHTAQGREAAVVILVLGGDPDKPGAPANWARTPNLVNVAASRAKRRLYVIGDREFWAKHHYFRELANALR